MDDYTVGSLADLISGTKTPNKPKVVKKPFKASPKVLESNGEVVGNTPTPKKHKGKKDKELNESINEEKKSPKKRKISESAIDEDLNESKHSKKKKAKLEKKAQKKLKQEQDESVNETLVASDEENTKAKSPSKKSKKHQKLEKAADEESELPAEKTDFEKNAERRVKKKGKDVQKAQHEPNLEELARTIYVGNVPLNVNKSKFSKFFSKFGTVETVRFRGVPRADIKTSKKVAAIKKQFHPDRQSFIAYVRFDSRESAVKALEANGKNFKEHHLRVNLADDKAKPDEQKAVFIGNLSFDAEEEDLWRLFEKSGPIESVRIIRDKVTQIGKGFGYINFKTTDAAHLALELNGDTYKNRALRVSPCNIKAAKKNKKLNKQQKIKQPGKPKAKTMKGKAPKQFKKSENSEDATVETNNVKEQSIGSQKFQGVKTEEKKKKNKFNKGLLQKKKVAKKLMASPKKVDA